MGLAGFCLLYEYKTFTYETIRKIESEDVDRSWRRAADYRSLFQDLSNDFFFLSALRKDSRTFSSRFSDVSVPRDNSLFTFFR